MRDKPVSSGLQLRQRRCYLITVTRLLTLLIMFALAVTNCAGVAGAMCQHEDARAHAEALRSSDRIVSQSAQTEDAASEAASKKRSATDSSGTSLAGYALPPEVFSIAPRLPEPQARHAADSAALRNRALQPMLEPPLA